MKEARVKYKTKSGEYWTTCPHCLTESPMGVWAVAHSGECDLVYTCQSCGKKSQLRRRCCDLADKVEE